MFVLMAQLLDDLLGRLEGEIGAADHQQRRDQERGEGGQQQRCRKQDQQLVAERPDRDLADNRKLALGGEADDVAWRDGSVVDHDACRLGGRFSRGTGDVIERRCGELGDGRDIVEQGDQSGRHGSGVRQLASKSQFAQVPHMLSLDFIKANRETVERAIRDKGVMLDLGEILELDAQVRALKTEIEALRAERNAISAQFPKAAADEKAELGRKAKEAGAKVSVLEGRLAGEEAALSILMLRLPGIPWEGAPVGPDESANVVVRTVGEPPKFRFDPLDHVALIEKNDWADLSRITQVAGSRTYCLK